MAWVNDKKLIEENIKYINISEVCDNANITTRTFYLGMKQDSYKSMTSGQRKAISAVKEAIVALIELDK